MVSPDLSNGITSPSRWRAIRRALRTWRR
jgi:hypothetical protein